jgi:hypothetical protein
MDACGPRWRRLIAVYSVAAAVLLALGVAIDASFFAHFTNDYSYTTPVDLADVVRVCIAFRAADLLPPDWRLAVVSLSIITVVGLVRSARFGAVVLTAAVLQLPLLIFFPTGLLGALCDLGGLTDGEWFHESGPLIESVALWVPVPVAVVVAALVERERTLVKKPASSG